MSNLFEKFVSDSGRKCTIHRKSLQHAAKGNLSEHIARLFVSC